MCTHTWPAHCMHTRTMHTHCMHTHALQADAVHAADITHPCTLHACSAPIHPTCKQCMHHAHPAHADITRAACTLCTAIALQVGCTIAHCKHHQCTLLLTHVKLIAPLLEGVAAAPSLVVLLQHQHTFAHLGQDARSCQPPNATADDNSIQILRHACSTEPCAWREERCAACMQQQEACTHTACSLHPRCVRRCSTQCTSTAHAVCTREVCKMHLCSVHSSSTQCTSTQCAVWSHAACSMHP